MNLFKTNHPRTVNAIIQFLVDNGPQPFPTILQHLNSEECKSVRYGCSQGRLGNLLSKNLQFVECGKTYIAEKYYWVTIWGLDELYEVNELWAS